jgi:hypothetical protein
LVVIGGGVLEGGGCCGVGLTLGWGWGSRARENGGENGPEILSKIGPKCAIKIFKNNLKISAYFL